jgi:hypothetical protein
MTLASHITTQPADELRIVLLEINGAGWPAPLRFAESITDYTVTLEGALGVATFLGWTGFDATEGAADDAVLDQRQLEVPDMDLVFWRRIETNRGTDNAIEVIVRQYLSSDLSAPISVRQLQVSSPSREGRSVKFGAVSPDPSNRSAPAIKYTWANSAGLRR